MKTEHFQIAKSDIEAFKLACKELDGQIELVSINKSNEATVRYTYDFNLFYLGQMVQLKLSSLSMNNK